MINHLIRTKPKQKSQALLGNWLFCLPIKKDIFVDALFDDVSLFTPS